MWNKMKGLIAERLSLLVVMLIGINPQDFWADIKDTPNPKPLGLKLGKIDIIASGVANGIKGGSSRQHDGVQLAWPTDSSSADKGET